MLEAAPLLTTFIVATSAVVPAFLLGFRSSLGSICQRRFRGGSAASPYSTSIVPGGSVSLVVSDTLTLEAMNLWIPNTPSGLKMQV